MKRTMQSYDFDLATEFGIETAVVFAHICKKCAKIGAVTIIKVTIKEIMLANPFLTHYKTKQSLSLLVGHGYLEDFGDCFYKLKDGRILENYD